MNSVDHFTALAQAYQLAGGDLAVLQSSQVARLVVSGNQVLETNEMPGVHMQADQMKDGVRVRLRVEPGTVLEQPIHLCFGVVPQEGRQVILSEYDIGEGARVEFVSHCSFPNAVDVLHLMEATVRVGAQAKMVYNEVHYHGPQGGVVTRPKTRASIGPGGHYQAGFRMVQGRIGELDIDFSADLDSGATAEFTTKAYGKGDDRIRVKEVVYLRGAESRGLTKTNIVVVDRAHTEVYTEMHGLAAGSRGHMECTEIVGGQAVARNVPVVLVSDENAKVTHEAAIGSVDRKQIETLMARGLAEDEAVDVVVQGLLR